MAYIRVDKDQPQDPKVYDVVDEICQDLAISEITGYRDGKPLAAEDLPPAVTRELVRNALIGGLVTLWCYADSHIRRDNTLPLSVTGVSQVTGLPVAWLEALPDEWLRLREDGTVVLPRYCEKNRLIPKDERRAGTGKTSAARTRAYRARQASQKAVSQGATRPVTATHTGTGPGPGPIDHTGTIPGAASPTPLTAASAAGNSEAGLPPLEPRKRALGLAQAGLTAQHIAKKLRPDGVTLEQVEDWLKAGLSAAYPA